MNRDKYAPTPWLFFMPATPWNIWNLLLSSNSGQVASTGRSRAARQQARLLYAVAVSMVSLGSPKAWNFVAKIPMFPQSTNFPRYPWNVPQTPKQQFMFGKCVSFGMPGDAWGMLELDTACGNDRGHGPTKCLFPDGSSTPRLGDCPDFWDISMIVIPQKKASIRGSWDSKHQSNYKLQKAVSKCVISKLSF